MPKLALLLILGMAMPLAATAQVCSDVISVYSSDPLTLANEWLAPIERMYAALPSPSPREEQWLTGEINSGDAQRTARAVRSSTFALQAAKPNAGSLFAALRRITGALAIPESESLAEQWRFFAYTLISYDAPSHLARLVSDNVIERAAIPEPWVSFAGPDFPLDAAIRSARVGLARHVLICILPQVRP